MPRDLSSCTHHEGAQHDCAYVTQRNAKVDAAWYDAVRAVGDGPQAVRRFADNMNARMGTPNWNTAERARKEALRDLPRRAA